MAVQKPTMSFWGLLPSLVYLIAGHIFYYLSLAGKFFLREKPELRTVTRLSEYCCFFSLFILTTVRWKRHLCARPYRNLSDLHAARIGPLPASFSFIIKVFTVSPPQRYTGNVMTRTEVRKLSDQTLIQGSVLWPGLPRIDNDIF
jgi:hypothetical protein